MNRLTAELLCMAYAKSSPTLWAESFSDGRKSAGIKYSNAVPLHESGPLRPPHAPIFLAGAK